MFVEMLKNAFKPNDTARSHNLLRKGSVVEVTEAEGSILIDKGYAAEWKPTKTEEAKESKKKKSEEAPAA